MISLLDRLPFLARVAHLRDLSIAELAPAVADQAEKAIAGAHDQKPTERRGQLLELVAGFDHQVHARGGSLSG